MAHRYWCSECSFRTPWLSTAEGERQPIAHYAAKHAGTPPGGQVERRRAGSFGGHGCLRLAAVALVLLAVVAACHRQHAHGTGPVPAPGPDRPRQATRHQPES
ncbi:hypothetical protein [Kitasatospora sp. NPDC059571]|uniref:hypothetical protein n=1 Tax=Kitasatospora sp. NPDC059571 TaxID=3346871 RepID=UPI00369003FD